MLLSNAVFYSSTEDVKVSFFLDVLLLISQRVHPLIAHYTEWPGQKSKLELTQSIHKNLLQFLKS